MQSKVGSEKTLLEKEVLPGRAQEWLGEGTERILPLFRHSQTEGFSNPVASTLGRGAGHPVDFKSPLHIIVERHCRCGMYDAQGLLPVSSGSACMIEKRGSFQKTAGA